MTIYVLMIPARESNVNERMTRKGSSNASSIPWSVPEKCKRDPHDSSLGDEAQNEDLSVKLDPTRRSPLQRLAPK